MLMKFTSPDAQRVVEAVEARESKRLFHLRNKKTVADQIRKCAKAVAADHTGTGFAIRRPSALRRGNVHFGKLTSLFGYGGQFAHGLFGLGLNVMKCTPIRNRQTQPLFGIVSPNN